MVKNLEILLQIYQRFLSQNVISPVDLTECLIFIIYLSLCDKNWQFNNESTIVSTIIFNSVIDFISSFSPTDISQKEVIVNLFNFFKNEIICNPINVCKIGACSQFFKLRSLLLMDDLRNLVSEVISRIYSGNCSTEIVRLIFNDIKSQNISDVKMCIEVLHSLFSQ